MRTSGLEPRWSSPPGDTITAALRDRGMHSADLIELLELSPEEVSDLLEGRRSITISIARSLEKTIGGSVSFWIARDAQYRDDCIRVSVDHWSQSFPIRQMADFGWITKPNSWQECIATCLNFFDVEEIGEFNERYSRLIDRVHYRTSQAFQVDEAAAVAWFRACERAAESIEPLHDYNSQLFERTLAEIRDLTLSKRPEKFVPELIERCAICGVAVAVVPAPSGFPVSGAARLYNSRPLIQLSARFLSDDHLWFTFFHEAGHVLLHPLDSPFVDLEDFSEAHQIEVTEREANAFASEKLVGNHSFPIGPYSHKEVLRIAARLGISPGIVVGQLQHAGKIPQSHLNKLKRRYIWRGTSLGTVERN